MEKPNKLADLKLVNKYYPPAGVANYSYPSPKLDSMSQCERLVGRSSVGSEASVPDMVDDRESIISTDEDDKSFYHASGAELWDKFWEDPFWEANAEEAEREADGIAQRILNRNASYPALIPSPDESRQKDQYFLEHGDASVVPETEPSFTWPLAVAEPPISPQPVTPKVSYSLFPRQTPTPPAALNSSPRRAGLTPRCRSLWANPGFNDSTASLTSLGRSSRARKAHSDIPVGTGRSSWTTSIAMTPAVLPSPPAVEVPTRRDSRQSINVAKQQIPVRPTRTRSDTLASQSSITPAPRSPITEVSSNDKPLPPRPTAHFPAPLCAPQRHGDRRSQPEARRIPPPLSLHRCTAETESPSPHQCCHSRTTSRVYARTNPSTPTMPTHPEPLPVSVFEVDSDSDEEEEGGGGGTSFARRIARSFTSQVRTRSASAAPRSRKGQEVARQQLRRARADTVESPSEDGGEVPATPVEDKSGRSPRPPLLRKQKSEVFGKIFWNRW